jgi:hypothetical protein
VLLLHVDVDEMPISSHEPAVKLPVQQCAITHSITRSLTHSPAGPHQWHVVLAAHCEQLIALHGSTHGICTHIANAHTPMRERTQHALSRTVVGACDTAPGAVALHTSLGMSR